MSSCPYCGVQLSSSSASICPNCQSSLVAEHAVPGVSYTQPKSKFESGFAPLTNYFNTLWEILSRPTRYFQQMPIQGGFSGPLAFALVTHWIGAALQFLWTSAVGGIISRQLDTVIKMFGDVADVDNPGRSANMLHQFKDQVGHWILGAGSVIVDPFLTLAIIFFTTLLVFIAARIFVTPNRDDLPQITFESTLRIICFAMAPAILAGLPLVGGLVSGFYVVIVTIIAVREVYRTSNGQAIVVALFPKLLFLGIILFGILALSLFMFKIISTGF